MQDQTNNKAKQHNTPKAVTFPKKNKLAFEPTTVHTLDKAFSRQLSWLCPNLASTCNIFFSTLTLQGFCRQGGAENREV